MHEDLTFEAREKDLGGFQVKRVLPYAKKRMVGPFIFLDQMGPARFDPGQGIDVRAHPHIGLSTLTYLFEGSLLHRDSLGFVQEIEPGAVNWMTAGSGISHSERSPLEKRKSTQAIYGLQFWVALPKEKEDCDPSFFHTPKKEIPEFSYQGAQIKLIAGEALGFRSPVKTHSPLFYLDLQLKKNDQIELPSLGQETAVYFLNSRDAGKMIVFGNREFRFKAEEDSHLILLGGEAFSEERHIWWNLVSSDTEKIEKAKERWEKNQFPMVPGESERIPLPK